MSTTEWKKSLRPTPPMSGTHTPAHPMIPLSTHIPLSMQPTHGFDGSFSRWNDEKINTKDEKVPTYDPLTWTWESIMKSATEHGTITNPYNHENSALNSYNPPCFPSRPTTVTMSKTTTKTETTTVTIEDRSRERAISDHGASK
jgi:hypothetical protein